MDRQGLKKRFESHSKREPVDRLEVADEFIDAVGPLGMQMSRTNVSNFFCKTNEKVTKSLALLLGHNRNIVEKQVVSPSQEHDNADDLDQQ